MNKRRTYWTRALATVTAFFAVACSGVDRITEPLPVAQASSACLQAYSRIPVTGARLPNRYRASLGAKSASVLYDVSGSDCPTPGVGGQVDVDWGTFDGGPNAAMDWGNDFGDNFGFVFWESENPDNADLFAEAGQEDAECPICALSELAAALEEDSPEIEAEAAALEESATGLALRTVEGWKNIGAKALGQWHHIATDKNSVAGSQWTLQFDPMFESMGLDLSSSANKVYVIAHYGPHPEEYHQAVYDRLFAASQNGATAFLNELNAIGVECATRGTYLNGLLRRMNSF